MNGIIGREISCVINDFIGKVWIIRVINYFNNGKVVVF